MDRVGIAWLHTTVWVGTVLALAGLPSGPGVAAPPAAPIPESPFLPVVYRYADTLLQKGRDQHGPQQTGLFLSALDRDRLAPLTNRPAAPGGIREGDRVGPTGGPLTGANPQHDENLLRVLYTLSELSGDAKYREAADAELKWFLENAASAQTHLLPWGEHMSWDTVADQPAPKGAEAAHEFFRPWLLWGRCFQLAPQASRQAAAALWEHQIADQKTGAFDRHAAFWQHGPRDGNDFPRHAGFYVRTWAAAYEQTRETVFLESLGVLLSRFENKRHPTTRLIPSHTGSSNAWVSSTLSLAIDCDGAAHVVPEPMCSRLRAFAAREDELFCSLPHDLKGSGGFLTGLDLGTGRPVAAPTPLWEARYGENTTAQVGMMCVARYENTSRVAYRDLMHAAAEAYLQSWPGEGIDVWPATLGHAISLQLAAWRSTARAAYLDRARELGRWAVEHFFAGQTLPRASLKTAHYESITGADTLALALVELHLHILHITAVRPPPNTIDR